MTEHNSSGQYFSMIPHWVIFSGVSSGAIHLFAVLAKYADYDTHEAYPARTTLAKGIGKSVDTVDRHVKELQKIGALEVTKRKKSGSNENQTSIYRLIYFDPSNERVAAPVRLVPEDNADLPASMRPGVAAEVRLGGRMDTAENEIHLTKPITNKNPPAQRERLLVRDNFNAEGDFEKVNSLPASRQEVGPPPPDATALLDELWPDRKARKAS